jgi:hypothetical protein
MATVLASCVRLRTIRQYSVEECGGHVWTFSRSLADVAPEKLGGESDLPRFESCDEGPRGRPLAPVNGAETE